MPQSSKDLQILEYKDMVAQLNAKVCAQDKTINEQNSVIEGLQVELAKLQAFIDYFKQNYFGSTSEKRVPHIEGQIDLFSNDTDKEAAEVDPEFVTVAEHQRRVRKPKATLNENFDKLEKVVDHVDTLTDDQKKCPLCGTQMVPIGEELVRKYLELIPAKIVLHEVMGTTYTCPKCKETEEPQFVKDEGTPALIPGSYASPSLVTHVMYSKYGMHVPLYRQEQDFLRMNAPINRTTMANWIIYCAQQYLDPMYQYFHRQLKTRLFLCADETPIQVLKEQDRRPQTKSYVWLVRTGNDGEAPIILYHYTPTRAGKNAAEFLDGAPPGFYLMTDGYQGYNKVPDKRRCCCYAHIRRYFLKAIPHGHDKDYACPAVQAVLYCDKLFEYERKYIEKSYTFEQIRDHRLKDEEPVIDKFLEWADKQHPKNGDGIIKALTYLNGCRPYMKNYLNDGRCSLSNNLSEQNIKTVVMGRKNWLFCNTPDGANASMTVFSIIETAKANGLDPMKYIRFLLEKCPSEIMDDDTLAQFTPWDENVIAVCK